MLVPRRIVARIALGLVLLLAGLPGFGPSGPRPALAIPTVWIVTSTADGAGACPDPANCTLRQAVTNAVVGDTITFGLAGPGPYTITLGSALTLNQGITITGYSQTGAAANSLPVGPPFSSNAVVLVTLKAGAPGYAGLILNAPSTITGLRIVGFDAGIQINNTGGGPSTQITGNIIGIGANGAADPNIVGVRLTNTGTTFIGPSPLFGLTNNANVISGNSSVGVLLEGVAPGSINDSVIGNLIGTNQAGTAAVPNGTAPSGGLSAAGIWVKDGALQTNIGDDFASTPNTPGNLISGNAGSGVLIEGIGVAFTRVRKSYIGLNGTGTAAIPNTIGVQLRNKPIATEIGRNTGDPTFVNTISGNGTGVLIDNTLGTNLYGNRIGTNSAGTAAVPNGTGVVLDHDGSSTTITGGNSLTRAIISGNTGAGVQIRGAQTFQNAILGTFIGTDLTGVSAIPNGTGVLLSNANGTTIDTSRVAFNVGKGVVITGTTGVTNTIRNTTIFANGGLGIDLGDDGVTPNGVNPNPARPNRGQNYPTLTSAIFAGGVLTVTGTLTSTPSTTFDIQLFGNAAPDPSGFGQGQAPIATTSATTNAAGQATISYVTAGFAGVAGYITATATDPNGNTSEFSNDVTIAPAADLSLAMSHTDPFTAGSQGTYTLTTFNGSGALVPGPFQIVDTLPAGLTYASASGPGWSCGAAAQVVTCTNPASLLPADTLTLNLTVQVAPAATGTVTNTATLTSAASPADPPANNTAVNPTTIVAAPTPPPPGTGTGTLQFVAPIRVVDTRNGTGVQADGRRRAAAALPPGSVTRFRIAGETFGGTSVPTGTTGVLINVTISQQSASGGFLTVYPGDAASPPNVSTVNPARPIAANFWTVALPTTGANAGTINVYSVGEQARDVIIDLVGYYGPTGRSAQAAGNLVFVAPTRVLDTRNGTGFQLNGQPIPTGPVAPNVLNQFALGGKTFGSVGFPADVSGILAHVTIVQDQASGGFTTLLPGDFPSVPTVSTVNPSMATAFNAWAVGLPSSGPAKGAFGIYTTNSSQHVVVDVVGYFSASAPVSPLTQSLVTPVRVVDTRPDTGGPIGFTETGAPITPGRLPNNATRHYKLAGQTFGTGPSQLTIPTDVKAGLMNVTIVQDQAAGGFLTVFPGDAAAPSASTVNPVTAVAASFWWSGVGASGPFAGTLGVLSVGDPRDVLIDLVGYYR